MKNFIELTNRGSQREKVLININAISELWANKENTAIRYDNDKYRTVEEDYETVKKMIQEAIQP